MYFLAAELHKTVAEIRLLSSRELTGWQAFYQIKTWMKKADTDDPEKAWDLARSVQEILERRAREVTDV